ncbi:hypothetical protein [Mycobacterium phage Azrael100]|nr:hypothetical protein COSMO_168 [Mycobacterium phage Cosmo]QGJ90025.1 hypothetical protein PBI_MARYV_153 [Mycobacterium phage MaryV]WKR36148.1 hypothetical protein [Mycobacterium phage Azrael100]
MIKLAVKRVSPAWDEVEPSDLGYGDEAYDITNEVPPNFTGKHQLHDDNGHEVPWPTVFFDAYLGWVRELPERDHRGNFVLEPIFVHW